MMTIEFRLLRRTFLRRFVDNELLSFGAEAGPQALIWIVAVVLTPSIVMPFQWMSAYAWAFLQPPDVVQGMGWGHIVDLYQLAMVATGAVIALVWEALPLDRRDVMVLSALPVSWRTVGLAKIAALLTAWLAFIVGLTLVPSITFPMIALRGSGFTAVWFFLSHVVVVLLASLFIFSTLVALQAVLLNTLSATAFRRLVTIVQALLFFCTLTFLLLRPMSPPTHWPALLAQGSSLLYFPPMWFLGLAETLRGSDLPGFHGAARLALLATMSSVMVAGIAFAAGFRRHVRRTVESPEMAVRGAAGLVTRAARGMAHAVVRDPVERATFDFVTRSLARSPRHRLLMGGATGLGVAFGLPGFIALAQAVGSGGGQAGSAYPPLAVLVVPLALTFLLLLAMRVGFRLPTDAGAAWIVRLLERGDAAVYLAAVRKAMLALGVLPPLLLITPAIWWAWGTTLALKQLLFGLLLGVLLSNLLLGRFRSMPFTATTVGIADPHPGRWPLYLTGFLAYSITIAAIEQRLLMSPRAYVVTCALLALGIGAQVWRRRRRGAGPSGLVFDIEPEDSTIVLNVAS